MSTAFQDAIIIFKNVWRGTVKLLLEQTSKEHIAHLSWMAVIQAKGSFQKLLAHHHPEGLMVRRARRTGHQIPRANIVASWAHLGTPKNCLGPRKEVGMTPVRGEGGREAKAGGWQANGARKRAEKMLETSRAACRPDAAMWTRQDSCFSEALLRINPSLRTAQRVF